MTPHLLWSTPFALLLAAIALMPFLRKHWWEPNYPYVTLALALVPAAYYLFLAPTPARWLEGMEEYVSFVVLLASLYVISGGLVIHIGRPATPLNNVVLLLLGAVLANAFGTTGASMLLIRPYLRMNRAHLKPYHVVFFIFLVSNVGGLLTPIGDPPLFLGYLNGVPFWWVLQHCLKPWLLAVAVLLALFFTLDSLDHAKAPRKPPEDPGPAVHLLGVHNLLFIALVLFAVFQPGLFDVLHKARHASFSPASLPKLLLSREPLMAAAALASYLITRRPIYARNEFTFAPIREVAILFVGVFSTMVPALQWLNANAKSLPLKTPGQFYFTSGALSAVLDNAPTYLTFLQLELGKLDPADVSRAETELKKMTATGKLDVDPALPEPVRNALTSAVQHHAPAIRAGTVTPAQLKVGFLLGDPHLARFIVAISMGSVLFGACTYIGNGPNFMVKSIADAAGAKTPGFAAYALYYALPILLPTYVLLWYLFLR